MSDTPYFDAYMKGKRSSNRKQKIFNEWVRIITRNAWTEQQINRLYGRLYEEDLEIDC